MAVDPHVSNDEKLARLARESTQLLVRRERAWAVFDVRLNYRSDEARIGATEEIENIIVKAHEAGYALERTESFQIPLIGGGTPHRVHLLLIFRTVV